MLLSLCLPCYSLPVLYLLRVVRSAVFSFNGDSIECLPACLDVITVQVISMVKRSLSGHLMSNMCLRERERERGDEFHRSSSVGK